MKKDLVILVADKNMEYALKGILTRLPSLQIRPIKWNIFVDDLHDPGCALRGVESLSNLSRMYHHGLLIFDHEGSGKERIEPKKLQGKINKKFSNSIWGDRARAIVIFPELEAWIWSGSTHVDDVAGWKNQNPSLRRWLTDQGWLQVGEIKPSRPKEAFEAALRKTQRPRSASLYQKIAEKVSLTSCKDKSFQEFVDVMRKWFPMK